MISEGARPWGRGRSGDILSDLCSYFCALPKLLRQALLLSELQLLLLHYGYFAFKLLCLPSNSCRHAAEDTDRRSETRRALGGSSSTICPVNVTPPHQNYLRLTPSKTLHLVNLFLLKLVRISGFLSLFSAIAVLLALTRKMCWKYCDRWEREENPEILTNLRRKRLARQRPLQRPLQKPSEKKNFWGPGVL